MLRLKILVLLNVLFAQCLFSQQKSGIISKEDFLFLEGITKSVLDSSRILPGQSLPDPFGKNNTGGILVRPGGRSTYPSFWIRDYAMTLETGFITKAEQKHMLVLTASTQCDQTWITKGGSMVPFGSIADHIRVDDLKPIYFPGTYDYQEQGTNEFGTFPAYCDQFYFIHMADFYLKQTGDWAILLKEINGIRLIDRLEIAFKTLPARSENEIVHTTDAFRGVDFGFRDAIAITGDLSYTSILKYRAANQLSAIFSKQKNKTKSEQYKEIAIKIKNALPMFIDNNGMLRASNRRSGQADVWATSLAIYLNVLEGEAALKAAKHLDQAYRDGKLAHKGSIRHIIHGEDYDQNTAWQTGIVSLNTYQNGAYWSTPTGWVTNAIAKVNKESATKLVKEYIDDLRENDFRKGGNYNAPYECFYPGGYTRGPVYLTSVSCPYIVLRSF